MACKKRDVARSCKEIATIFNIDNAIVTKGCKTLQTILNRKDKGAPLPPCKPDDFIDRFCSKLKLSDKILNMCMYIIRKIEQYRLVPKSTPQSVAASTIYYVVSLLSDCELQKKNITDVCEISGVTIDKCKKELEKYSKYILPPQVYDKLGLE